MNDNGVCRTAPATPGLLNRDLMSCKEIASIKDKIIVNCLNVLNIFFLNISKSVSYFD